MATAIVIIILIITCLGCASRKALNTTNDFLSEALQNPMKFEKAVVLSRYWAYDKFLVHFISNINEDNKNLSPIIYIHGLGGSLEDFSKIIQSIHHSKYSRPYYAIDLPPFGKSFMNNSELTIHDTSIKL